MNQDTSMMTLEQALDDLSHCPLTTSPFDAYRALANVLAKDNKHAAARLVYRLALSARLSFRTGLQAGQGLALLRKHADEEDVEDVVAALRALPRGAWTPPSHRQRGIGSLCEGFLIGNSVATSVLRHSELMVTPKGPTLTMAWMGVGDPRNVLLTMERIESLSAEWLNEGSMHIVLNDINRLSLVRVALLLGLMQEQGDETLRSLPHPVRKEHQQQMLALIQATTELAREGHQPDDPAFDGMYGRVQTLLVEMLTKEEEFFASENYAKQKVSQAKVAAFHTWWADVTLSLADFNSGQRLLLTLADHLDGKHVDQWSWLDTLGEDEEGRAVGEELAILCRILAKQVFTAKEAHDVVGGARWITSMSSIGTSAQAVETLAGVRGSDEAEAVRVGQEQMLKHRRPAGVEFGSPGSDAMSNPTFIALGSRTDLYQDAELSTSIEGVWEDPIPGAVARISQWAAVFRRMLLRRKVRISLVAGDALTVCDENGLLRRCGVRPVVMDTSNIADYTGALNLALSCSAALAPFADAHAVLTRPALILTSNILGFGPRDIPETEYHLCRGGRGGVPHGQINRFIDSTGQCQTGLHWTPHAHALLVDAATPLLGIAQTIVPLELDLDDNGRVSPTDCSNLWTAFVSVNADDAPTVPAGEAKCADLLAVLWRQLVFPPVPCPPHLCGGLRFNVIDAASHFCPNLETTATWVRLVSRVIHAEDRQRVIAGLAAKLSATRNSYAGLRQFELMYAAQRYWSDADREVAREHQGNFFLVADAPVEWSSMTVPVSVCVRLTGAFVGMREPSYALVLFAPGSNELVDKMLSLDGQMTAKAIRGDAYGRGRVPLVYTTFLRRSAAQNPHLVQIVDGIGFDYFSETVSLAWPNTRLDRGFPAGSGCKGIVVDTFDWSFVTDIFDIRALE